MTGNNFKLLRLLVAVKVVIGHAVDFLEIDLPPVLSGAYTVLRFFPGVPVFFAMSGYLLARSLEHKPDVRSYARSRALRIFPALWACGFATFALVAAAGLLFQLSPAKLAAFVVAQLTVGQSWAPFPVTDYGLGGPLTPNPALWTIRMSIGFYVVLPLLLLVGPRLIKRRAWLDVTFAALAVASLASFALIGDHLTDTTGYPLLLRLYVDTPGPYLWYLLTGVLLYRHESVIKKALVGRLWLWLSLFLAVRGTIWFIYQAGKGVEGEVPLAALGIANLIALAPAFSLAFSPSRALARLDPTNDLSYSIYLWHMVVLNALIHWELAGGWLGAALVMAGSVAIAKISWHTVEAPALALKRRRPAPTPLGSTPGYASPA